ncbi:MAG: YcbK family protein [Terriglobia bacterium]
MLVEFEGSPHFAREELECRCGCGKALIDPGLVDALENLRERVNVPIIIDDGYRCERHNAAVGGVPGSTHTRGLAADLRIEGQSLKVMYHSALLIDAFTFGGIGAYTGEDGTHPRLHCDVRENGPKRWGVRFGEQQVEIEEALSHAG